MDRERKLFVETLLLGREIVESILEQVPLKTHKIADVSERVRKRGNFLYGKNSHSSEEHENILSLYNESLAYAPEKSKELALAYGNRSAFLFHISKYQDCISDIDRALSISDSAGLKFKLLCRKAKCMLQLERQIGADIFQELQLILDEIPEGANRSSLEKMLNELKCLPTIIIHSNSDVENSISEEIVKAGDIFSSIRVGYNEKYGRHLIAIRDIKPGEIVFAEKMYASCLNLLRKYTNCQHCFTTCWSGIPCDHCNWAMFCSEKCKLEAEQNYHDVECTVVPFLEDICGDIIEYQKIQLCIRLIIMALKEANSMEKLKSDLDAVDNMGKSSPNFLMAEGVERRFTTIYSLSHDLEPGHSMACSFIAVGIATYLVKYTTIFEKNLELSNFQDLIENPDFIFIGSLCIRLMEIRQINSYCMTNLMLDFESDITFNFKTTEDKDDTAYGIALAANMINHSCIPNVNRIFTKDKEIVMYAVRPIPKNSQIFDSYFGCSYEMPIIQRENLLNGYVFNCDCQACDEDWKVKSVNYPLDICGFPAKVDNSTFSDFEKNAIECQNLYREDRIFTFSSAHCSKTSLGTWCF